MNAQMLQQQLQFNAEKLTGMYAEYASLRKSRALYNNYADEADKSSKEYATVGNAYGSEVCQQAAQDNREQANIFTPYLNKLRKRIAALEAVQKALKQELKSMQMLEAFVAEDDANWLKQAEIVVAEGYTEPGVVQELLDDFRYDDTITADQIQMIRKESVCGAPPSGWYCTREQGHDGPCAAWPSGD